MKAERKQKLNCCEKCHIYWTCETKWYRGERAEENICCDICNFYTQCEAGPSNNNKTTKK